MLSHLVLPLLAVAGVPVWPEVATWSGNFTIPAINWASPVVTYYDIHGDQPMWAQHIAVYDVNHIFVGTTKYDFKTKGNLTCTKSQLDAFPYPKNQFENFTLVSTDDRITREQNHVDSWVGTGMLGYAITMDTLQDAEQTVRRIVYIDKPGWHTEIRNYDEAKDSVPATAFAIPSYCH